MIGIFPVTLLLCNAAAMEALPIFLDKMMPSYLAVLVSVTAVLLFGEYGRRQLLLYWTPLRVRQIITRIILTYLGISLVIFILFLGI
jgi:hypothetical protein